MLICNPNAGRRDGESGLDAALEVLESRGWKVDVRPTAASQDATRLARQAVEAGLDAVLVAGGDGTLNEAVQALAGSRTALGYLPQGTVNVWAREAGIPLDPAAAAESFADGEVRSIDLGRANERYFLLMAGAGLDGVVVKRAARVERYKYRLGILPYVAVGLSSVPLYRGSDLELRYDGIIRRVQTLMLVVGNTRLYGGRWRFTPNAVVNDGLLDVCILKGRSPVSVVKHAVPLLVRRTVGRADVEFLRVRDLRVASAEPILLQLDGEPAGESPVHFTVASQALQVRVPRDSRIGLSA